MIIYGDYHTHTTYSHGKGSIEDSIKIANEKGLKEVAITDHGFSHKLFSVLRKEIPIIRRQVDKLKSKYKVKVLVGVEANLISMNGDIDITKEDEESLDIILMGYHKLVFANSLKDRFKFFYANSLAKIFGYSKKRIEVNTNAFVKAIEKNNIDIITHLGYSMQVDPIRVAKACKENGVYLELNGKRIAFTDNQMKEIIKTGVKFILNSDAHKDYSVGECQLGIKYALKYNIPEHQLANINKLPTFKKHR